MPTGDLDRGQGDDPFAYLSWLAGRGSLPRIAGTASVILGTRHPLVIARAAVGAQMHTGGSFILGLGSGGKPAMSEALGVSDRSAGLFRETWCAVRSALHGDVGAELSFALPTPWTPPPMFLASARRSHWEAIGGHADGWMAFAAAPGEMSTTLDMIRSVHGQDLPLALRVDLRVLDKCQAPARLPTPARGVLSCSLDQLRDLFGMWLALPIAHLLLRMTGPDPTADLHAVREIWDEAVTSR